MIRSFIRYQGRLGGGRMERLADLAASRPMGYAIPPLASHQPSRLTTGSVAIVLNPASEYLFVRNGLVRKYHLDEPT